jgi:hypothetical protein
MTSGTGSIEARLQRVEDELAIRRIIEDYAAFLDGRDFKGYVGLFAPDGNWTNAVGSYTGQDAIYQMLLDDVGVDGAPNRNNFHIITNERIDIDGDTAKSTCRYLFIFPSKTRQPVTALAGLYQDEFVRLENGWKIKRREAIEVLPTHDEWEKLFSLKTDS